MFRRLLLYDDDEFTSKSRTAKDYVDFLLSSPHIVHFVQQITYNCIALRVSDVQSLKTLLRLPKVYRLNFHYCDLRQVFSMGRALHRVVEICFLNCRLTWLALHNILSSCKKLDRLHLHGFLATFHGPSVVHEDIREKLVSLRRLHLDLSIFSSDTPVAVWSAYFFETRLHAFRAYVGNRVFEALNCILMNGIYLKTFECIIRRACSMT